MIHKITRQKKQLNQYVQNLLSEFPFPELPSDQENKQFQALLASDLIRSYAELTNFDPSKIYLNLVNNQLRIYFQMTVDGKTIPVIFAIFEIPPLY